MSAIARSTEAFRGAWRRRFAAIAASLLALGSAARASANEAEYLGDPAAGISLQHQQQWGDFGWNTAAAPSGAAGSPLQIGEQRFTNGLGHHANGEIVVELGGRYDRFLASVGVQWQGGKRGSVIFRVAVDGQVLFESGPMSDSDPAREVDVPVSGGRQLRLIASDAGDGIGCDMANWAEARLVSDSHAPRFGRCVLDLGGGLPPPVAAAAVGLAIVAQPDGPQVALMESAGRWTVSVGPGEEVRLTIQVGNAHGPLQILGEVRGVGDGPAEIEWELAGQRTPRSVRPGESIELVSAPVEFGQRSELVVVVRAVAGPAAASFRNLRYRWNAQTLPIPLLFPQVTQTIPPPVLPEPHPAIERELIEWDWRLQDGIGTPRERRTWAEAIQTVLERGDRLVEHLSAAGVALDAMRGQWAELRNRQRAMSVVGEADDQQWETLWREAHLLRRRIALANPLADTGPLVFAKRVPSSFSHQLTQYSGRCARPGGGLFVLERPGQSMYCRQLAQLPLGSYLHPDVSWDGRRILFSFCETDPAASNWRSNESQFYRLFEVDADGSGLRQLTDGPCDDFAPRYLPSGEILFVSTRRGGFHRCGQGPCPVHTLALADADGSNPRVISFHETHEWDPAVLHDGRVIYTRWDYVDRHAVFYQQLWTARPDGSGVAAFYGNNTLNPVGVWEARPVPGSTRVMATAAAHHAMTAGSIILLDVSRGIDGLEPITRLTPDALFPESESPVQHWHAPAGVTSRPEVSPEERRWPGHCYRTPFPLSEDFFLAAYSFDPLIGEPSANPPNQFGIYLVDRFGNKELIYRDVSIGSLWPIPLRARMRPPALPTAQEAQPAEGTFLLQNVNESWPSLSEAGGVVKRLRIVQVLPKTTPNANAPRVGLANASPGKQVLGTVPVEPDGSAWFRAPAGIPFAFQALDDRGMAVQTMRSLTYLQAGEQTGCVGCHEHRTSAPPAGAPPLAMQRPPSQIEPGPDGSNPLNYALLVQPVLDRHCVECHGGAEPDGGIDLSGTPVGEFTASYHALAPLVPYSEWKGTPQANHEPLTHPGRFGARASRLMQLLLEGHEDVVLSEEDYQRLITWMDANALFYGTFDPADQQRQRRGERISGPALQ